MRQTKNDALFVLRLALAAIAAIAFDRNCAGADIVDGSDGGLKKTVRIAGKTGRIRGFLIGNVTIFSQIFAAREMQEK